MASLSLVMDLVTFCSSYCSSCCFIPAVSKWASWFLLRSDHLPLPESGARGLCMQMSWRLSSVSCVHRSWVIGPYTWPGWGCIFLFPLIWAPDSVLACFSFPPFPIVILSFTAAPSTKKDPYTPILETSFFHRSPEKSGAFPFYQYSLASPSIL